MATSRCRRLSGRLAALIAPALLLAWVGATPLAAQTGDSAAGPLPVPVELRFLDVGQGDAVLIRAPGGRAVLYDGGGDGERLLGLLERAGVTSLELVIASHNHADHIGGLAAVIARYRPRYVIENGVPHTTRTYERFLRAILAAGTERLAPTRRVLALDSVRLEILPPPPPGEAAAGQNGSSVGLRVEYGAFSATLLGDAEGPQHRWWLARHRDLLAPVRVHKASHHGSVNGDTRALLDRLRPEVVVIGVGGGNRYGHPDARTLALYREIGAEVHRTDRHGTVTILGGRDGTVRVRHHGGTVATTAPRPPPRGAAGGGTGDRDAGSSPGCVDLNRADARALEAIIHIGPERAGQIIALRRERPFRSVAEVERVRGIGEARTRDILRQGLACVGRPAARTRESGPDLL